VPGTGRAYWRVALETARDHPVLGAGSGSFASLWRASAADRGARDAHSAFVEAVAELGVPGLCLLGVVLLVPFAAGVRARRTPWVAVATGAYGAVILHAAIDWDRELPVIVIVGSALAAALLTANRTLGSAVRPGGTAKQHLWLRPSLFARSHDDLPAIREHDDVTGLDVRRWTLPRHWASDGGGSRP
jgi:hypothetical protein